ncbi:MAG: NADH-quinone oxidoreductase subunit C, partial [Raoultibacter sp.]
MSLQTEFLPLEVANVKQCASDLKEQGYRYVQMLAVNTDDGIDLQYAYMKGSDLKMYTITGIKKGTKIPSITDLFLEAFVFENEAHDLFGVEIEGIAIDFGGHFYQVAQSEPMTVISPAQKAAREKAEKIAAAKAAKEKGTEAPVDDIEAKLAGMDPEKAAKVRAGLEAKAKKAA